MGGVPALSRNAKSPRRSCAINAMGIRVCKCTSVASAPQPFNHPPSARIRSLTNSIVDSFISKSKDAWHHPAYLLIKLWNRRDIPFRALNHSQRHAPPTSCRTTIRTLILLTQLPFILALPFLLNRAVLPRNHRHVMRLVPDSLRPLN